jgi:sugar phosphate isomerase/epimerase
MIKDFKSRIGIDLGRKMAVEQAIEWAARHGIHHIQVETDTLPNALDSFDTARCEAVRKLCAMHDVSLSLHTLSAVNVAEYSPFVSAAVDAYLTAYTDVAARIGVATIVVHAGYHFTGDYEYRKTAALERLRRVADYAAKSCVTLLLENLNKEPADAEVHYLAYDLAEFRYFLDRLDSPGLGCSFTVNHAHLVPEGIEGFLDVMPIDRLGEVRLADNLGDREVHLMPGTGNIDFGRLFERLERAGYKGRYMCNFGSPEDMLEGRDLLAGLAPAGPSFSEQQ